MAMGGSPRIALRATAPAVGSAPSPARGRGRETARPPAGRLDARGRRTPPSVFAVNLFRTKSVEDIGAEGEGDPEVGALRKRLSARHLIGFGIGVVIGTGIFTLTGVQAKNT